MLRVTRRHALCALGGLLSATAGCTQFTGDSAGITGTENGADATDGEGETTPGTDATATEHSLDDSTQTDGGTDEQTDTAEELDLREANVVGVEIAARDGGDYRFDVTLYHDDDGEDGYANWWQVETLDGEQLGRRKLLHAHSTDPFTRSETITVPDDVECVVVRGHDQTHGYGGQAMLVSVPDGAVCERGQGPEPELFTDTDCPCGARPARETSHNPS